MTHHSDEISEETLNAARKLFSGPCTFVKGVVDVEGLPADDLPEVTFAGRSNVGKSSLLNALTNRKNLARTSNTPGRTREVNYFDLGRRIYLVDLPGYGYARASKSLVRQWTELVFDYLRGRANLRRAFLLIDGRRGIMSADEQVMTMLDEAAVSYQVVATKMDKLKPRDSESLSDRLTTSLKPHVAAHPEILFTSAETGDGLDSLRMEIATFAAPVVAG